MEEISIEPKKELEIIDGYAAPKAESQNITVEKLKQFMPRELQYHSLYSE